MLLGTDTVSVCFTFFICETRTAFPYKAFCKAEVRSYEASTECCLGYSHYPSSPRCNSSTLLTTITTESSSAASLTSSRALHSALAPFYQSSWAALAEFFMFKALLSPPVLNARMTGTGSDLTCWLSKPADSAVSGVERKKKRQTLSSRCCQ